jgi:hypothetical protein
MVTMSGISGGRIVPLKSVTAVAPAALSIQKLEWPRKVSRTAPGGSAACCQAAGTSSGSVPAIGKHWAKAWAADPNAQSAAPAAISQQPMGHCRKPVGPRFTTDHAPTRVRVMTLPPTTAGSSTWFAVGQLCAIEPGWLQRDRAKMKPGRTIREGPRCRS